MPTYTEIFTNKAFKKLPPDSKSIVIKDLIKRGMITAEVPQPIATPAFEAGVKETMGLPAGNIEQGQGVGVKKAIGRFATEGLILFPAFKGAKIATNIARKVLPIAAKLPKFMKTATKMGLATELLGRAREVVALKTQGKPYTLEPEKEAAIMALATPPAEFAGAIAGKAIKGAYQFAKKYAPTPRPLLFGKPEVLVKGEKITKKLETLKALKDRQKIKEMSSDEIAAIQQEKLKKVIGKEKTPSIIVPETKKQYIDITKISQRIKPTQRALVHVPKTKLTPAQQKIIDDILKFEF